MMFTLASVWSRLQHEEWALILPGVAFFIFFAVFLYITIRITRMPKKETKHLAHIPFEDEEKKTPADHGKENES